MTEATLKGARTATKKKSRVAASCDELAPEGVTVKEKLVKIDLYAGSSNSIVVF